MCHMRRRGARPELRQELHVESWQEEESLKEASNTSLGAERERRRRRRRRRKRRRRRRNDNHPLSLSLSLSLALKRWI